jgi:23S rRNA maturation-related 3'-5' exoribonuclease YhaM
MEYYVVNQEAAVAKNGSTFHRIMLGDCDAIVRIVTCWDNNSNASYLHKCVDTTIAEGKYPTIVWANTKLVDENPVLMKMYNPDDDDMLTYLHSRLSNDCWKRLVERLRDEEWWTLFKTRPAATYHHHAYQGGLLIHTFEVIKYADALMLDATDKDCVLIAAMFHDVGKIYEYDDTGALVDFVKPHIIHSYDMFRDVVSRVLQKSDLPHYTEICHCILSHHGRLDWGSPIVPHTREAMILHCADMVSSFNVK